MTMQALAPFGFLLLLIPSSSSLGAEIDLEHVFLHGGAQLACVLDEGEGEVLGTLEAGASLGGATLSLRLGLAQVTGVTVELAYADLWTSSWLRLTPALTVSGGVRTELSCAAQAGVRLDPRTEIVVGLGCGLLMPMRSLSTGARAYWSVDFIWEILPYELALRLGLEGSQIWPGAASVMVGVVAGRASIDWNVGGNWVLTTTMTVGLNEDSPDLSIAFGFSWSGFPGAVAEP